MYKIYDLTNRLDKLLSPCINDRRKNAEVTTPIKLREDMLDTVPKEFWMNKKRVFEPCVGKGHFLVSIIERFLPYFDYKTIVEEMIYFADINSNNIDICIKLLNGDNDHYKLNYYIGDTLKLNFMKHFRVGGFDAVISNPPYHIRGNCGSQLWSKFTKKALNEFVGENGYLLFVHPPAWRKPNTKHCRSYGLYDLMTKYNTMLYLSIHGVKDGNKYFNCNTRFDYYLIQNKVDVTLTKVIDLERTEQYIDLREFDWLPNYNIKYIKDKLLARDDENRLTVLHDGSYHTGSKYLIVDEKIKEKDNELYKDYIFKCVHTTPKKGTRFFYCCDTLNTYYFRISKVIFGNCGINNVIIDDKGEYGLTSQAIGLKEDNIEIMKHMKDALETKQFKEFLKCVTWGNYQIDWRLFTYLKKDFYKEFETNK